MTTTLTIRERRVVSALKLALEANECDRTSAASIQTATRILRQPRLTDDQLQVTLTRLVIKDVVVRDTITGLGGSMSAWGIR